MATFRSSRSELKDRPRRSRATVVQQVASAARQAIKTGSLTPLIKEELWCKIQARRLSEGKGELIVRPSPPHACQLTVEDVERRRVRREQNKYSAQRFRMREKQKGQELLQNISNLEVKNRELEELHNTLTQEKNDLKIRFLEHLILCTKTDGVKPTEEQEKPPSNNMYNDDMKPSEDQKEKPSSSNMYNDDMKPSEDQKEKPSNSNMYNDDMKPSEDQKEKPSSSNMYNDDINGNES